MQGSWQNSGREPKLWILNSSSSFPLLLFLINISWGTFFLVIVTIAAFLVLDYYGYKPRVFARRMRSFAAGSCKVSRPWWT